MGRKTIDYCTECDKNFDIPKPSIKGMCINCYVKMYRKTDKAKEYFKIYNKTKGKEAMRRYLEKKGLLRPPRPPKGNCECGKMSVVKGLCLNCYHRNYQRNNPKLKPDSKPESKPNPILAEELFNKVSIEVKKGLTIQKSCKKHKIDRCLLYKLLNPIQKAELRAYKKIGKDYNEFNDEIYDR